MQINYIIHIYPKHCAYWSQGVSGLRPALASGTIIHRANDALSGRKRNMKLHDDIAQGAGLSAQCN